MVLKATTTCLLLVLHFTNILAFSLPANQRFVENKGQMLNPQGHKDPAILYQLTSEKMQVFLYQDKITWIWSTETADNRSHRHQCNILFLANKSTKISPQQLQKGYLNYYLPQCKEGVQEVRSFGKIMYENINGATDLTVFSSQEGISLQFSDQNPSITFEGDLEEFQKYFRQENPQLFTFNLSTLDSPQSPQETNCVDDPPFIVLEWGTYFGGSGSEVLRKVAVDQQGYVYVVGGTSSYDQIAYNGHDMSKSSGNDIFLAKFDAAGELQWATYYGGSGDDYGIQVVISSVGEIFISARTTSSSLATSGVHQTTNYGGGPWGDVLMAKFNAAGELQWATYFGGDGSDTGAVILDQNDQIYLSGQTESTNHIATSGAYLTSSQGDFDVYLARFNSDGTLDWATYFGGPDYEDGKQIAFDSNDNIYVSGFTQSSSGIASPGASQVTYGGRTFADAYWGDGFLVKFNPSGSRLWATYFGGSGNEGVHSVVVDSYNNVYMTGGTISSSGIATPGGHQTIYGGNTDAFLVKYDENGIKQWATYYGGSDYDLGWEVVVDDFDNVYLSGWAGSATNIATPNVHQSTLSGGSDAMIVKFDPSGTRLWGTYFGGVGNENSFGMTTRSGSDEIYLVGTTLSNEGIFLRGHQSTPGSSQDAFVAKFTPPSVSLSSREIDFKAELLENLESKLVWKIINLTDLRLIEIQKSRDGVSFETIGSSESRQSYFIDTQVIESAYYRLKIWESETKFIYSKISYLKSDESFLIYPNPVRDQIHVFLLPQDLTQPGDLQVYNLLGDLILQSNLLVGVNQIESMLSNQFLRLPSGMYIIKIRLENQVYIQKIVKSE